MAIILILRCARRDREVEFLQAYKRESPKHDDFISETLTRVDDSESLPEPMRSLKFTDKDCVQYLNVARWKSAQSFIEYFGPQTNHDPDIEVCDRLRLVLNEVPFGE